jgi:flagellar protein FliS
MQNYAREYKRTQVTTVDSLKLVVLLYDGAMGYLEKAREGCHQKDFESVSNNINRALDIIEELNNSLDINRGEQIAQNLRSLYLFMNGHLVKAKMKSDPQMIEEVMGMLKSLRGAWEEIEKKPETRESVRVDQKTANRGITV